MGQWKLGVAYELGQGVPQDDAAAVSWYRRAAEQGDSLGQLNLGVAYWNGRGVPQDYVEAHMWFNLAAAQGEDLAVRYRDKIAELLTREQLAEAQRRAREWFESNRSP